MLRSVPEAINKRLSNILSDKNAFDSAVPPFQESLQKSGYSYKLQYNLNHQNLNDPEVEM